MSRRNHIVIKARTGIFLFKILNRSQNFMQAKKWIYSIGHFESADMPECKLRSGFISWS